MDSQPVDPNSSLQSPSGQQGGGLNDPVSPTLTAPQTSPDLKAKKKKLLVISVILVVVVAAGGLYALKGHPAPQSVGSVNSGNASGCQISAVLVNSCRPWFGAAASGNPGTAKDAVSQFTYLETLTGRKLDIFRDYHAYPGANSGTKDQPLNAAEIQLAARSNTYIDVNWNPSSSWQQSLPVSGGGDVATNANIDAVAKSIKSVAPHKVFLSLWHEANLLVDAQDPGQTACGDPSSGSRQYGSPSLFNAAWRNVYARFQAIGVNNVVWVMNYSSYEPKNCWVKYLWPGNQYVDWVVYDTYSRGKNWDETAGVFYKLLESDSTSSEDFNSKPWGIGEFGTCKQDKGISEVAYYQSVKAALDANTYPNLKMYLVYADTGNNSGPGCLTNYDSNGQKDDAKLQAFNALANDTVLTTRR